MSDLTALGWDDTLAEQFEPHAAAGLVAGRVAVQHRGAYDVLTELGELRCDVAGRLYDESASPADLPAVGDWVAVAARAATSRRGRSRPSFPAARSSRARPPGRRPRSRCSRRTSTSSSSSRSLNEDLNLRRLERYLILARESGAQPVVLLTKSDLAADVADAPAAVDSIAADVPVVALSSVSGEGLDAVRSWLRPGVTAALLGSSGVGKSTLVNTLAGEELLTTQEIRDDGQGRHTTTRRELVRLPGGALVIDTPGMRELQLWVADEGLEETFEDVTSLFDQCRFSDCSHDSEPGCAVKAALQDGTLAPERWESYLKLQAELAHLERRLDKRAASEERKRWKALSRFSRDAARAKGRK